MRDNLCTSLLAFGQTTPTTLLLPKDMSYSNFEYITVIGSPYGFTMTPMGIATSF